MERNAKVHPDKSQNVQKFKSLKSNRAPTINNNQPQHLAPPEQPLELDLRGALLERLTFLLLLFAIK